MRYYLLVIIVIISMAFAGLQSFQPVTDKGKKVALGEMPAGQGLMAFQGKDSTPVIRIEGRPTQQPPEMYSLLIPGRSIVIRAYTSPAGRKVLFDIICKSQEQLKMRLSPADDEEDVLWSRSLTIEGYARQPLNMAERSGGDYKLQIMGSEGKPLKNLMIVKAR